MELKWDGFRGIRQDARRSKEDHELAVGRAFIEEYNRLKNTSFAVEKLDPDPPDLIADSPPKRMGIEVVQLYHEHDEVFRAEAVMKSFYRLVRKMGYESRYSGVAMTVLCRRALDQAAGVRDLSHQLVDLLTAVLPDESSVENLRCSTLEQSPSMIVHTVGQDAQEPLGTYVDRVVFGLCSSDDCRFPNGLAAPGLLIQPPITNLHTHGLDRIVSQLQRKRSRVAQWRVETDLRVLVVHDLPRGKVYEAFGMDWPSLVKKANGNVHIEEVFDEVWLVEVAKEDGQQRGALYPKRLLP
jgi:hypothetical protein